MGFPGGLVVKNPPALQEKSFHLWVGKIPWRRKWQPTPASLPGKFHAQRSPAGYSPLGSKESDMTEHNKIILKLRHRMKNSTAVHKKKTNLLLLHKV